MCNGKHTIRNSSDIQNIYINRTNKNVYDLYGTKYKIITDRFK